MATEGHTATVRSEVFETRIALSFFGGVSLAVYESGTAVEFFRLVTGDGIYKKLHDLQANLEDAPAPTAA